MRTIEANKPYYSSNGFDILMDMRNHQTFRVLAAIDLSSAAGQQKLAGLHRFLSEGYDWDLEMIRTRDACTEERISLAANDGVDGFIMAIPMPVERYRLHRTLGVPTAFIDYPNTQTLHNFRNCVFVMDDTRDICRTAVRALLSGRIRASYGYVDARDSPRWSRERGDMFASELLKRKIKLERIESPDAADRSKLARWIGMLPKPAAILAAYDDTALSVLNACKSIGIKVPNEVSILGIGNDETVCNHTTPRISSVKPDFEAEGYRAARELQAMMIRRGTLSHRTFLCGSSYMIERETARTGSAANMLANDTLVFINENAFRRINARDVAKQFHVSRRLLDLRFRQQTGTSIQKYIIWKRLSEVRRLLSESSLPISEIAVRCGYPDSNYLKNLFKRRFAMSMRNYRNQHCTN